MKVLFICSGDVNGKPKVVVRNQGESLRRAGIEIDYFCINGGGIKSYLLAIPGIRKKIGQFKPAVIHAHYSFSGITATFANASPLVVSLMGSDTRQNMGINSLTRFFSRSYWRITIVKSPEMKSRYRLPNAVVVPNGVDTELFRPIPTSEACLKTGLQDNQLNILFVGNPERPEKNFSLVTEAVARLSGINYKVVAVFDKDPSLMPYFYNASSLLLLTSLSEGSPNAVKEAMACNLPVIATDVGDVSDLLRNVNNCFVTGFDADEIAAHITNIFSANQRSDGRERIMSLGLDAASVAARLIEIYKNVSGRGE